MNIKSLSIFCLALTSSLFSCLQPQENSFWGDGKEFFDIKEINSDSNRVHSVNILVAKDGTVLLGGGDHNHVLWQSLDGGETFVLNPAYPKSSNNTWAGKNSWGFHLDEETGDVLKFDSGFTFTNDTLGGSAPQEFVMWRSKDHGRTWEEEIVDRDKDANGWYSWEGGCETGITLQYGEKKGRLLRATRTFVEYQNYGDHFNDHYSSAIYSDDGGKTWQASGPFPVTATGESALAELSDGRIYFNSRRHLHSFNRQVAWSYDGGETWRDPEEAKELPDGPRDKEYGLMGGLVRLPIDDYDILIFSNVDSPSGRFRSTVWASFDGGKTWPVKRLVDEGGSAYSSLTAGREGTKTEGLIYLLKEGVGQDPHRGIQVARFNLPWITKGRDWKEFIPPAK